MKVGAKEHGISGVEERERAARLALLVPARSHAVVTKHVHYLTRASITSAVSARNSLEQYALAKEMLYNRTNPMLYPVVAIILHALFIDAVSGSESMSFHRNILGLHQLLYA